jgi:hypothetical protein
VTQNSLREQIGMVTQDTSLLHRSVRENIVYGRPDATEEVVLAAAKRAEADEFVGGLTDHDLQPRGGERPRIEDQALLRKPRRHGTPSAITAMSVNHFMTGRHHCGGAATMKSLCAYRPKFGHGPDLGFPTWYHSREEGKCVA